jgi:hypothetical protein
METEQFNIRLNKAMLYDLEFISQKYKVDKNDWLRTRLAEMIMQERTSIIDSENERYIQGYLTDNEYTMSTGLVPTAGLREMKTELLRLRFNASAEQRSKAFRENTLSALNLDATGKKVFYDGHTKRVMKKVEKTKRKEQ